MSQGVVQNGAQKSPEGPVLMRFEGLWTETTSASTLWTDEGSLWHVSEHEKDVPMRVAPWYELPRNSGYSSFRDLAARAANVTEGPWLWGHHQRDRTHLD